MPFFNKQKLRDQRGFGLIHLFILIVIMGIVMAMSGFFDPPKSEVTDTREGVVLDNPTSKKDTLNIIDLPIGIPTIPVPTPRPTIVLPTRPPTTPPPPAPTRIPTPTPSGPTSTPRPTRTPTPPLPTPTYTPG